MYFFCEEKVHTFECVAKDRQEKVHTFECVAKDRQAFHSFIHSFNFIWFIINKYTITNIQPIINITFD